MKILSADEIRAWDEYTILNEPISSIDLMERAASRCSEWLMHHYPEASSFRVYCAKGNNGGDGLAIARMLMQNNYQVSVHILEFGHKGTDDFQTNLARLHNIPGHDIHFIQSDEHFNTIESGTVIVDALFGSGLNRPLEGVTARLVEHINRANAEVISIDLPSGLFTDRSSKDTVCIHARHTLSFQVYKAAFLFAENKEAIGVVHILDIGLDPNYMEQLDSRYTWTDHSLARSIHRPRSRFSHKGDFGHALMIAGSHGKIGAAVLASKACLRSGVGLLTAYVPGCGYNIIQNSVPEAMVICDKNEKIATEIASTDLSKYKSVGIGPGLGTARETQNFISEILQQYRKPVVLDADALNIIATNKELLQKIPAGSILTPHPKEFERLFGTADHDFERAEMAFQQAKELNCIIVLKGHHTLIATPGQKGFFNSSGNPGMATAGTGDVLTGILTGLLSQGYDSIHAAILGCFLHGLAGDLAAQHNSEEAMIADDIVDFLGAAFRLISK